MEKNKQKQLITEIMNEDAKDGLYKKQTAVDFLLRELRIEDLAKGEQLSVVLHICKEAKEMEKQQIMKAVYDAMGTNFDPNMGRAELYYNETYGGNNE